MKRLFLLAQCLIAFIFLPARQKTDEQTLLKILGNKDIQLFAKNDSLIRRYYVQCDSAARVQFLDFLNNQTNSNDLFLATAEIRFAVLTRLNLGNKHIASMLGIGADAVRKTKSRLRQRLQLTAETDLDDFIKKIS